MYGLPESTDRHQQLPKKAIYAKFNLKAKQQEIFDRDISRIDIVAVVSQATIPALNISDSLKEFYVLAIEMKRKDYDVKNLLLLNNLLPHKMVFALRYGYMTRFVIHHSKLFCSDWMQDEEAELPLVGISLDLIWENIVIAVGHINLDQGNTLLQQIEINDKNSTLSSKIDLLKRKMANEKQPRRKRDFFEQIKRLQEMIHS